MILSPNVNCCAVTIFEYSSTDVTLLPSCLSVLGEHVASQSKWQSAGHLDLLKQAKKRKCVWSALFRGNVCIWSDKISNVSAIKIYSEVESEPKHEVATIEREFKI